MWVAVGLDFGFESLDLKPTIMRRDWQIMALLAAATVAVFWPVRWQEFVNYDDPAYVTFNPVVREGLTWPGVVWAFTNLHGEATYWHPLTWLSHMLDCQLFGLKPAGHHLSSLLLHTLNTLLLFAVLRRMTGRRGASAAVAALFALHPLAVDSVAWIAERKNLLSTCFGLLCLWTYARYAESQRQNAECRMQNAQRPDPISEGVTCTAVPGSTFDVRCSVLDVPPPPSPAVGRFWYWTALALFALSLMSKPALVPLPILLLLLDYWPLGRLQLNTRNSNLKTLSAVLEKLPFFALSAASSLVTIWSMSSLGGLLSAQALPVSLRLANAPVACAVYLRKLFWPVDLCVFYLHPGSWPADVVADSLLLVLGITAVAVWQARRRPYLMVGWLWFLVMLAPVIGLVQAHVQAVADRFTYVPAIGIFVMVVWAVADWYAHRQAMRAEPPADTVPQPPDGPARQTVPAPGGLEVCEAAAGKPAPAGGRLPGYVLPSLAALVLAGCVVMTLLQLRYWRNSLTLMQRVVQVEPNSYMARLMLGNALFERRDLDGALSEYEASVRLRPAYPDAWERAGVVLTEQGQPAAAVPYLLKAAELAPAWPEAQRRLALALLLQGKKNEAQAAYRKLASLMPPTADGLRDLADMLAEGRQYAQAVQCFKEALRLRPDFEPALNNLAMLRASCPQAEFRNGAEAVQLAEAACRLSRRRNPSFLGTLAAAYAEAGRYGDAVRTIQDALAASQASGASELVPIQTRMLGLFQAGHPYRLG
jgi:tetratricopeptide (TPR) repeat protein